MKAVKLLSGTASAIVFSFMGTAHAQTAMPADSVVPPSDATTGQTGVPAGDIVVTGIRRSLQTAQAIKQDSDQIVDSIVAEDIGKLPDSTAAESLARITGVQVTRNAGVAQGVTLRGLSDIATTYNGREVFTADGRTVALQDFPSNGIARLDVFKSGSADQVEAGLAGLIDVRSRRPLDFKGTVFTVAGAGVHWYQSQRLGEEGNALFSTRWRTGLGDMGFLIEGSYAQQRFIDSTRAVSQTILNRTDVPGYVGQSIRLPSFVNVNYDSGTRWRPNAATSFQWRPSRTLELYLDGLAQRYRAHNDPHNFQDNTGQLATLSNVELFEGTNLIKSVDVTGGGTPNIVQQDNESWTDTYQAGGGFHWADGNLKVNGDFAFTDSVYTNLFYVFNYTTVTAPARSFDFDTAAGAGGGVTTVSADLLSNPSYYRWTGSTESGTRGHGRSWQYRADVDWQVHVPAISSIQAGLRYVTRDSDSYSFSRTDTIPTGQTYLLSQLPMSYGAASFGFRNDDATSLRTWLTPDFDSFVSNIDYLRSLTGQAAGWPDFGDPVYTSNEKTYSAYLQAHYEIRLGVPIDGLIGLRVTRTEDDINGLTRATTSAGTTTSPINVQKQYDDYLPNVSARVRLTPELALRLAFTQTRTRPGFSQLNPSLTIGTPPAVCSTDPSSSDCIRTASSGNANLNPIKSTNYDTSLEWYFSRDGSVTVGYFHKDLDGFINSYTNDVTDAQYGRLRVTAPQNGGKGRVDGIEAGARSFLRASWVPRWAQNFGGLVNYTYLDATSELAPSLAATLPGQQRIAGISKHTLNVSAFYDNDVVSARLSYNYRSNFVSSYGQVADPALASTATIPTLAVVEDGRGTLDFAATLTPVRNITLSFNATNLLGQAAQNSRVFNAAGQSYIWQTRFLESIYRLGVRFRL